MSDDMKILPMMQPRRVLTRSFQNTEYKMRIARVITEIDDFEEEIMVFEEASANDIIFAQISSPGGSLETCDFLCRRMEDCQAPIVVEIGMTCASAASALCLQADDWIVNDSSTLMIHACSYSPGYGKEVDVRASVDNTARINKEWVERTYSGFLTDEELEKVLDGKDLYFYADDLRDRLPKYKEYRESLQEAGCGNIDCQDCNPSDLEFEESEFDLKAMVKEALAELLDERGISKPIAKEVVPKTTKPKAAKKPEQPPTTEYVAKK